MSLLNSVLKVFVGDKKKKDLKIQQPVIDKVLLFDKEFSALSLDQLRAKTAEFKNRIKEATKPFQDQIEALTKESETATIDRKEEIYKETGFRRIKEEEKG